MFANDFSGFHMYVVAKGSIDVFKGDVKVNTLGPKKVFGELALLYNSKRNATILGLYLFLNKFERFEIFILIIY